MDAYLIKGVRENNEAVFSSVYQHYHVKLYGYFFEKTRSLPISKELVQTTFIKFWNHRYHLNPEMALSPQLFRIAKTTFIDLLREKTRERAVRFETEELVPDLLNSAPAKHPRFEEVEASLAKIPPQRSKIVRYRLEGLSNQEIADHLGISKKTVENQLNKAVKEIRNYIHSDPGLSFPLYLICLIYS